MTNIRVIDKFSIADFQWPDSESSRLASHFIAHHVTDGTEPYIGNTKHDVMLAVIGNEVLPLVINHGNSSHCYSTSPYVNYIGYAKDFILSIKYRWLRWLLLAFISLISCTVRQNYLDKVVYINHWIVATGPQLYLPIDKIDALLCVLKEKFSGYAFVFKNVRKKELLNFVSHRRCEHKLNYIFNRNIYLWSSYIKNTREMRKNFKKDRKILNKNIGLFELLTEIEPKIATRLCELYKKLYVEKYSIFNNNYTPFWFAKILKNPLMKIYVVRQNNEIVYFATYFICNNELISCVVGHEPTISKQHGLYRLGMSFLMSIAEDLNITLNLSSGSGQFKLNRGCTSIAEYELLCFDHLPFYKRISWLIISKVYNTLGLKIFSALSI